MNMHLQHSSNSGNISTKQEAELVQSRARWAKCGGARRAVTSSSFEWVSCFTQLRLW